MGDAFESIKPGNRGKRDSQLILMQFLSRIHCNSNMNGLEIELNRIFHYHLGLDTKSFEFLIWVDSDTEIYPDSTSHFVSQMCNDSEVIGICGETLLRNEGKSWITMIQVYEYFITHNFSKAFESLFGAVTCLPGCFSMYRIWSPETGKLYLAGPKIIAEYGFNKVDTLHLKNLLSLGEDRYLTTLMLKTYPEAKLKFTGDAKALTNAPERWSVLLSQRRRWINSTVHNLLELMTLNNLCGCCMFSIRFVVAMELFSTVMAPSGFLYVLWLLYSLVTDDSVQIPLISIIIICSIYGLQVIIFVLKQEWQHLGWMIIVTKFNPVYYRTTCIFVLASSILFLAF